MHSVDLDLVMAVHVATDMVFCACLLVEKAIEHNTKVFFFLLTCKKHTILYPDQLAMWLVLQKYSILGVMMI